MSSMSLIGCSIPRVIKNHELTTEVVNQLEKYSNEINRPMDVHLFNGGLFASSPCQPKQLTLAHTGRMRQGGYNLFLSLPKRDSCSPLLF